MNISGKFVIPVLLLGAVLAFLALNAPLSNGLTIGGDDGFELAKAQLLKRQPEMAARLHNDQPWLHTLLMARAFAIFGENAAIPRLFSITCTFLLVLCIWRLFGTRDMSLERCGFLLFYFGSRQIPILSTSAMLEPVTMSLAVLAVATAYSRGVALPSWRGYAAGAFMALAAWTKLTALIVCPAWAFLLYQQRQTVPLKSLLPRLATGFLIVSSVAMAISPTLSLDALWNSHLRASRLIDAGDAAHYSFRADDVFSEWTILLPVLLGIVRLWVERDRPRQGTMFALVWLLTDFAVHIPHKPWWGYYAIHFHIPIAFLAADGTAWILRKAWSGITSESREPALRQFAKWQISESLAASLAAITASVVLACWFGIRLPAFWKEAADINGRETSDYNAFVSTIRGYAGRANWLYCTENYISFHAGVLQPPELVIYTYKRRVTGELSKDKIAAVVQRYKPELLLLRRDGEFTDPRFKTLLADGRYVRVMWSGMTELWVASSLHPSESRRPEEMVKVLGL